MLDSLLAKWREALVTGTGDPATVTCDFVLWHCAHKHGALWLGSSKPGWTAPSPARSVLLEIGYLNLPISPRARRILPTLTERKSLLENFQLKGVREDSHRGLAGWLNAEFPLLWRLDRPSPLEMLDLQCAGERCATLHLAPEEQWISIGRHAGAYEFLLHDLEHAAKFFGATFHGQVQFFNQVRDALRAGVFAPWWSDPIFRADFEYLISDMNSHPVHLIKYLKAIWLEALRRSEGSGDSLESHWESLLNHWQLPAEVSEAAHRLNRPELEQETDRISISEYFLETRYGN